MVDATSLRKISPSSGRGPGDVDDGGELLEFELVDRRVAPDFFAL